MNETLTYPGSAVKALEEKDGVLKLAGHLVVFGDANKTDLSGEWFTPDTYFGPHNGDGCDALFHHGIPIKGLESISSRVFAPLKVTKDEIGLFAEWVGNAADEYDRALYESAKAGKIRFSSGTDPRLMARKSGTGEITRWPIIEGSFTPTPCEPRAVVAAKSLPVSELPALKFIFENQEQAEEAFVRVAEEAERSYYAEMRAIEMQYIQREFMRAEAEAALAFLAACRA